MTITHTKVSAVPDGADTTKVRPSDWNAAHELAAGYSFLRVATVTLNDAEIKALPTTPFEIVAPTETNNYVGTPTQIPFPLFTVIALHVVQPYTAQVGHQLYVALDQYADVFLSGADSSSTIESTFDTIVVMLPVIDVVGSQLESRVFSSIPNGSVNDNGLFLAMQNSSVDLGDGDPGNSMTVTVFYAYADTSNLT